MFKIQKLKKITGLLFTLVTIAGAAGSGQNGFPMLKMDVDARAAAMAGAFTSVVSDAGAVFWNPAGLTEGTAKSFMIMHNVWIADITQEFAAFRFRNGRHNIGVSVNLMTIPGIQIRGEIPTEQPEGETDAYTFSAALGYGTVIKDDLSLGITLKYLFEKYYLEQAPGWAVDLGIKKNDILKGVDWGLTIQNLGKMKPLKNVETPLPLMARTGLSYHLPWNLAGNRPLLAGELQYIKDEGSYLRIGSEVQVYSNILLRLGWISGENTNHPTAGFGLMYKDYHLNYAYIPVEYDLGNSHRISLNINF